MWISRKSLLFALIVSLMTVLGVAWHIQNLGFVLMPWVETEHVEGGAEG